MRAPALPVAVLFGLLAGCAPSGGKGPRGVLVIAIDQLRADHVSAYGYDRPTTPSLERLAARGVVALQCFAAAPEPIPAHVALLTGCDPRIAHRPPVPTGMFRSLSREWRIPARVPRLAAELLAAGFHTAAFLDHPHLDARLGFDIGFQTFRGFRQGGAAGDVDVGITAVGMRFLQWLGELDSDEDWFAYLSLSDLDRIWTVPDPLRDSFFRPRPELDAVPPVAYADRAYFALPYPRWDGGIHTLGELEARYDGALRQLDRDIGRLLQALEHRGLLEDTLVVVVGSHGIGFGEAGRILESGTLSDVDLHVPLLLKPARWCPLPEGTRTAALASTIDIAPTILALAGAQVPAGMHGRPLVPALRGGDEPARRYAFASGGDQPGFSVRTAELTYERISRAEGTRRDLARSWTGTRGSIAAEPTELLYRRSPGRDRGDLEAGLEDPALAATLREAGESWYGWIDLARRALHSVPWPTEPLPPGTVEELIAGGWIAPQH